MLGLPIGSYMYKINNYFIHENNRILCSMTMCQSFKLLKHLIRTSFKLNINYFKSLNL